MTEDKYTIEPLSDKLKATFADSGLTVGDTIDMLTGETIVGPYCQWPKTEPRYFRVLSTSKDKIKSYKPFDKYRW